MPANLRRHGYKGSINMDDTGALTTFTPVASMKSWTIEMSRDRQDVTCFLDPNRVFTQGLSEIKGSLVGAWEAEASRALLDVMMGDAAVGLKLVPSELDPLAFFSGLAYLDGGMDVAVDGAIEINGSWVAAGPWKLDPVAAQQPMAFGDPMPLRGRVGAIRWYHYTAAAVRDFTVSYSRDRSAWTLRGGVLAPNAFNLQQAPLMFAAPVKGGGDLRWPILSFQIQDGRVLATLGPPAPGKDTIQ